MKRFSIKLLSINLLVDKHHHHVQEVEDQAQHQPGLPEEVAALLVSIQALEEVGALLEASAPLPQPVEELLMTIVELLESIIPETSGAGSSDPAIAYLKCALGSARHFRRNLPQALQAIGEVVEDLRRLPALFPVAEAIDEWRLRDAIANFDEATADIEEPALHEAMTGTDKAIAGLRRVFDRMNNQEAVGPRWLRLCDQYKWIID